MLKSISPHRLLFLSIFIWFAFYSAIPTTYVNIEPVFFAVLMLVFYIGAFLFGMFVIRGDKELIKKVCTPRDKLITYIAVFFGSLGTLFKFYQRFIQQGYLFAEDYTRLRIELMAGEFVWTTKSVKSVGSGCAEKGAKILTMVMRYFEATYQSNIWKKEDKDD